MLHQSRGIRKIAECDLLYGFSIKIVPSLCLVTDQFVYLFRNACCKLVCLLFSIQCFKDILFKVIE